MEDLIEAYLSVYEDSDIKARAKAAVDHQRHGDHGDDDALQKATKAVKKATRYPGRQGPIATPSLPESYDEFDEGYKRMNRTKIERQASRLGAIKVGHAAKKKAERQADESSTKSAAKRKRTTDMSKVRVGEAFDTYDLVLTHLLDEGYCDSQDSAVKMMAAMSEDWINSIVEEFVDPEHGETPSGRTPMQNIEDKPRRVRKKAIRGFLKQMDKEYSGPGNGKWKYHER